MQNIKSKISKILPYLMLLLPLFCVNKTIDNDFWFIANHGRYILNNGFTSIEPFTVHEGLAFSFEKWATCILFYKIYEIFSGSGVIIFVSLMSLLIEYLFYKCVSYISKNKLMNIAITAFTCAIFNGYFAVSRPQIISYVLLLLQFLYLEKYARTNNKKYLIILPILSMIYMQFHSTMWPMFIIMFMPYIFDIEIIAKKLKLDEGRYDKKPLIIVALLSVLTALINPYGFSSIVYLAKSMGVNNGLISELNKTTIINLVVYAFVPLIIQIIYLTKVRNGERVNMMRLRYIYIMLGTFSMTAYALRNISYFILYSGIIGAFMLETIDMQEYTSKFKLVAIFVPILGMLASYPVNNDLYSGTYGYEALNALNEKVENTQEIKLYTDFNSGAYAEWLGFKAYIDPRAEVFLEKVNNKEDIMSEYIKFHTGQTSYKDMQDKYKFMYWNVRKGSAVDTYMSLDTQYVKIVETDTYNVYQYGK